MKLHHRWQDEKERIYSCSISYLRVNFTSSLILQPGHHFTAVTKHESYLHQETSRLHSVWQTRSTTQDKITTSRRLFMKKPFHQLLLLRSQCIIQLPYVLTRG